MHPVVFSSGWFDRYQSVLLGLLRVPVIGRELRDVLAIRRHDVGYDGRIVRITPHSYTVAHPDGTFTTDFRTHAKYAKRLRYQLDGLWKAAHAWDQYVANPLAPVLNVGFDTLTVYPDPGTGATTVDGVVVRNGVDESWSAIRSGAGTVSDAGSASWPTFYMEASATSNQWAIVRRCIFTFDTASIGSGVVSSATLSLYGAGKGDNLVAAPDVDVYAATPAANNSLSASDYGQIGSVSQTGSPISYAAWNTAGYNPFTFNATGVANIAAAGISRFGTRNANYDVANTAPPWVITSNAFVESYHADQTGSANDPKLDVTYSIPNFLLVTLLGTTP